MSELDLDDVAATSPKAQAELAALRSINTEMLAVLVYVRHVFPMARWADDTREMIRVVINKAEGKTK